MVTKVSSRIMATRHEIDGKHKKVTARACRMSVGSAQAYKSKVRARKESLQSKLRHAKLAERSSLQSKARACKGSLQSKVGHAGGNRQREPVPS
eukprot:1157702-Pelagomonas_calceolata.AAC.6